MSRWMIDLHSEIHRYGAIGCWVPWQSSPTSKTRLLFERSATLFSSSKRSASSRFEIVGCFWDNPLEQMLNFQVAVDIVVDIVQRLFDYSRRTNRCNLSSMKWFPLRSARSTTPDIIDFFVWIKIKYERYSDSHTTQLIQFHIIFNIVHLTK